MPDYELQDSGERTTFDTGAQRDLAKGKGRYDLISPHLVRRLAIVLEKGAEKYNDRNWEKGMPWHSFLDSALRHTFKRLLGMQDEDHAAQAVWNLMAFIHHEETPSLQHLNDLPEPRRFLDDPSLYMKGAQDEPQHATTDRPKIINYDPSNRSCTVCGSQLCAVGPWLGC